MPRFNQRIPDITAKGLHYLPLAFQLFLFCYASQELIQSPDRHVGLEVPEVFENVRQGRQKPQN